MKPTWNDTNGRACDPSAFVEVPLDAEDGDAIEEGEKEEEAGVDVEEQERLLGDVALGVSIGHLGDGGEILRVRKRKVPLSGGAC